METELLFNLGILIFFSVIGGIISTKLKQPLVLGLLIIGMLIGPNMLGIIYDEHLINIFITLGTILFIFMIGMEFSLDKILKIGIKALFVVIFKIGIMFFFGFLVMTLFNFDIVTATFVGVIISFSSTTIIANILKHKNLIHRQEVPLIMSVSIMEDIVAIFAITLFKTLKNSSAITLINSLEQIFIGLVVLLTIYVIISKFAEKMVTWIRNNSPDEMILFTSLLLCSAFAYLAYKLNIGASIGAFLAGSIISNFKELKSFRNSIQPYNYMFGAFFFISIGTLVNLKSLFENIPLLLLLMITIFIGLFLAIGLITKVFVNYSTESSIFSSIVMIPPAVFSLLLAHESKAYGVSVDLFSIISIIMLIFSFALTYFSSRTKLFTNLLPTKKTILKTTINNVSTYFETLFNEISLENNNSKTVKKNFKSLAVNLLFILVTLIISKEIVTFFYNQNKLSFFISIVIFTLIFSFEIYNLTKYLTKFYESIVKIVGLIDGGAKLKRIRNATIKLFTGIALMFIGIYSPLILFISRISPKFVYVSLFIVLLSLYLYKLASDDLHKISYYTTKIEYKKIKYDVALLQKRYEQEN